MRRDSTQLHHAVDREDERSRTKVERRFTPGLEIHVPLAGHFPSITFETTNVVSSSISMPAVPRRTAPSGLTISTGPSLATIRGVTMRSPFGMATTGPAPQFGVSCALQATRAAVALSKGDIPARAFRSSNEGSQDAGSAHAVFPKANSESLAVSHTRPGIGRERRGRRARHARRRGFAVRLLHVGFLARIGLRSASMTWMNGEPAAANFDGEFSSLTISDAGKGTVGYAW